MKISMKISMTGLCVFAFAFLTGSVHAQCGCSATTYAPMTYTSRVVPMTYASPVYSTPTQTYAASPASGISFVNKLASPLDRGTYQLNYAVHLNNGRVLYTEYLPQGYAVKGVEAGRNGRRVNADIGNDGLVNVNDPVNRQIIAVIPR